MSGKSDDTQATNEPDVVVEPGPEGATPEAAPDDGPDLKVAPDPEPEPELDPQVVRIAALEKTNADQLARLRLVSKAYTDLQKEMDAFRKRTVAQTGLQLEAQKFKVVRAFFDPVQNLQRSVEAGNADPEAFFNGVSMVHKQFGDAMTGLGLTAIPGEGAVFDPKMHEALALMPVTDPAQDGRVLMVHVNGFKMGDKVLQAAQVVIGKHTPEQVEAETAEA